MVHNLWQGRSRVLEGDCWLISQSDIEDLKCFHWQRTQPRSGLHISLWLHTGLSISAQVSSHKWHKERFPARCPNSVALVGVLVCVRIRCYSHRLVPHLQMYLAYFIDQSVLSVTPVTFAAPGPFPGTKFRPGWSESPGQCFNFARAWP